MSMSNSAGVSPTEGAGRTIDVLLMFMESTGTLGVSELARSLDANKATVSRALRTLVSRGLVEYDEESRRYRLGLSAVALGVRASRDFGLQAAARGALHDLSLRTGETVTLSCLAGRGRVYIDSIVGSRESVLNVALGQLIPLHAGASSKAILAFMDEARIDDVIEHGLARLTPGTISDPDELRAELVRIRVDGYATSEGERDANAVSLAAPIFDRSGKVCGSTSVFAPKQRVGRMDVHSWSVPAVEAALAISQRLPALSGLLASSS